MTKKEQMTFHPDVLTTRTGLRGKLAAVADAVRRELRRRVLRARTYRALSSLSDRELDDLGLSRYGLWTVADRAARNG